MENGIPIEHFKDLFPSIVVQIKTFRSTVKTCLEDVGINSNLNIRNNRHKVFPVELIHIIVEYSLF